MVDVSIVITGLPRIQADLGFTAAGLSWVHNAYTVAEQGWHDRLAQAALDGTASKAARRWERVLQQASRSSRRGLVSSIPTVRHRARRLLGGLRDG